MNALSRLFATLRAAGSHERATHRTRRRHSRRPSSLIAGEALEPKQLMAVDVVNAFADQSLTTSAPTTIAITNQFDLNDVIGTVAKFETNAPLGGTAGLTSNDFYVELYDKSGAAGTITSGTVSNFLSYVNDGSYDNSMIHRSVSDFVIQGGGFTAPSVAADQPGSDPVAIATKGTITNEPGNSNLRGTIAMAKLGGQPNSATSQWFVNQSDNTFLDTDNGGYAVFGEVLGDGMTIVDVLGSALTYDATTYYSNSAFSDLPLWNVNADNIVLPQDFVKIETITALTDESELMTYSVTTSDSSKLAASINASGDLVLTPVAGQTGSVNVTVTATSKLDGSTAVDSFLINLGTELQDESLSIIENDGVWLQYGISTKRLLADQTQISDAQGRGVLSNSYPQWNPRAAETIDGSNYIVWSNSTTLAASLWTLDADWKLINAASLTAGTDQYFQLETSWNIDLNDDGEIGPPVERIPTDSGTQELNVKSGYLYVGNQSITGPSLAPLTRYPFAAWEAIGAETIGGDNVLLLWNSQSEAFARWTFDATWSFIGGTTVPRETTTFFELETQFEFDGNDDSEFGAPLSRIPTDAGNVSLQSRLGYLYADGMQMLGVNSQPIRQAAFSGWTALAAELIDGVNTLVWQNNTSRALALWKFTASWEFTGANTASTGSDEYFATEQSFSLDADSDGIVGPPSVPLQTDRGNQVIVKRQNFLYVNDVAIYGPSGNQLTETPYTGWSIVASETLATGNYLIARHVTGTAARWEMSATWTFVSGITYQIDSPELQSIEDDFLVDLDDDRLIANSPKPLAFDEGGVLAGTDLDGNLYVDGIQLLDVSGNAVNENSYAAWIPLAAETIDGRNTLIWKNRTTNDMAKWTVGTDARLLSATIVQVGQASYSQLELDFHIDTNEDGFWGLGPTRLSTDLGQVALGRNASGELYADSQLITGPTAQSCSLTSYSEWTPIGAETADGTNLLVWQHNINASYAVWEMSTDWTFVSGSTHAVGSATYISITASLS
jgi:cyclophilin family peptidyl-prolyl cis-trans isomerase